MITVDELRRRVAGGAIDTVINAFCDMQGRLMGKRVTGDFFVEHCLEHGTHFCVYLLGTDMEMETPDGYRLMNWESGYGDWQARPDWNTLRIIPWHEKTALVLADVVDEETGETVDDRAAHDPAHADSNAPRRWAARSRWPPSWSSTCSPIPTRQAHAKRLPAT